jgi:hypothetical protein
MVETALRTRQRVFLPPPFFHRSLWVRAAKADYGRKTATDDETQQQESE